MFSFEIRARSRATGARTGILRTPHGDLATPMFLPVGTRATVRGIHPDDLRRVGARMLLANTVHLALRPGPELMRELGGLHRFMGWDGPLLTDSGGFQVFSLEHLCKVDEDGATFRSVVDGSRVRFTPESVMDIQRALGADVVMAFDHCPSDPAARDEVAAATERTQRWLERCVRAWQDAGAESSGQALFGIVQGGVFQDLRRAAVEATTAHDLPGYAIGGVSVGEERAAMLAAVEAAAPLLPEEKPRYLMGVGLPLDFLEAVERGIDLFDCVTPTRHGRNHQAFTARGRINLRNQVWQRDPLPLEPDCDCPACERFSRAYLRHLCMSGEMLAGILLTLHNLRFFFRMMEEIRSAIETDSLASLRPKMAQAQERVAE